MPTTNKTATKLQELTPTQEIRRQRVDYAKLLQDGCIMRLHIGRVRFIERLSTEDMGLAKTALTEQKLNELLSLGDKLLWPKKMLQAADNIEGRARRLLRPGDNPRVFATPMGTFVPVTYYVDLWQELQDLRAEYMNQPQQMIANYDLICEQMRVSYTAAAHEAFDRFCREIPGFDQNREEFVTNYTNRIASAIPPPERIQNTFYFDVEVEYVPLPSDLAENIQVAALVSADTQAQLEIKRAETQAEIDARTAAARADRTEAETRAAVSWAERRVAMTAAEQREEALAKMNEEVLAQTRQRMNKLASDFERTVAKQLNETVLDAMADLLKALRKNNKVNQRNINQLATLVKTLKQASFTPNATIEDVIERCEELLGQRKRKATSPQSTFAQVLSDITIVIRAQLMDLDPDGETSRRTLTDDLGIPTEITPELATSARTRIANAPVEIEPELFEVMERA